jgi:hypothetical protein
MAASRAAASPSARGSALGGPAPRHTCVLGTSWRMFANDQRVRGNWKWLMSAKRTTRSAGGGAPNIHASAAGSVSAAEGNCVGVLMPAR